MLKTPLCTLLGIEYPILSVGMGVNIAGPELAAAGASVRHCGRQFGPCDIHAHADRQDGVFKAK